MNIFGFIGLISTLVFINLFGGNIKETKPKAQTLASQQKNITYTKQPVKQGSSNLEIGASSALSYDLDSGILIYEKNIDQRQSIASINKLMTALVIMQSHKPNEVVKVPKLPALGPYDQKMGLSEGEEFELSELLKATLIQSANDAANALAIYDSGSVEKFVEKMNKQAQLWDLNNSKFSNATGLEGGDDYSSARDVLTMGRVLYQNETFRDIVATSSQNVSNQVGKSYLITTTNKILGKYGVIGMKTGYTLKAGECLVTVAERNGQKIITVVLDSPDRFQESKNMIDWSFSNYIWQ